MNLQDIINRLNLEILTNKKDFGSVIPSGAYCSDLLSCVMSGAQHQSLWITLQCHGNIVAVAALLDLTAIIITENAQPDPETIAKANEEGITILSSEQKNYEVCGHLWELGLHS